MNGGQFSDAIPGEVVVGEVEFRDMAKHRDKSDQALIIKLTVAQVKNINTTKVSVSKDLPCHFMDTFLGEMGSRNLDSLHSPQLIENVLDVTCSVFILPFSP